MPSIEYFSLKWFLLVTALTGKRLQLSFPYEASSSLGDGCLCLVFRVGHLIANSMLLALRKEDYHDAQLDLCLGMALSSLR